MTTSKVFSGLSFALAFGLALVFGQASLAADSPTVLSFEDRVDAQRAIEEVYWRHRIWPQENLAPKPALSSVMPDALLRDRVADYLRKSNALETWWQRPITGEQLQAELDRMAAGSQDPAMLRELFDALGNDARLIAETLARQTLADRLIRNWYASDDRFHGAIRRQAEAVIGRVSSGAERETFGDHYAARTLGQRNDRRADRGVTAANSMAPSHAEDQGHAAGVTWPQQSFDAWWSVEQDRSSSELATVEGFFSIPAAVREGCADDTWSSRYYSPASRREHTAVWTGSEMIVWGGSSSSTGGRYNPATDSWTYLSTDLNLPSFGYTAVWTGREMIVWGGSAGGNVNTGGRYNPTTNTWASTSTGTNVPAARSGHTAVWTGRIMIVWGGSGGGYLNTGGRYEPLTDTWMATSTGANVPSQRRGHAAIWTGKEMVVWGGTSGSGVFSTGGRYTPSTDSWVVTSTGTNMPVARMSPSAIWTGKEMIVWGGADAHPNPYGLDGGRYRPATDSWVSMSSTNAAGDRWKHTAVWTGKEMIVWGGIGELEQHLNTGGRYDPSTNTWTQTSIAANVPSRRGWHTAVWTGSEMIIWGGGVDDDGTVDVFNTGGRYDPSTNTWIATSTGVGVPDGRQNPTAVWTGAEMIVWGGFEGGPAISISQKTGGRYSPSTDSWTATSTGANVPSARSSHSAVWTGTEMIIWGGAGQNTGGRYNPVTDSWMSTSTGANVPAPRSGPTAIWTGTEMIIWGGAGSGVQTTGGRYDPSTDTWTSTSAANIPTKRGNHTAVWTGKEMIVWGGSTTSDVSTNTGSRYDPSTDSWTATSVDANVPGPKYDHTAVWTGTEMIVWGGTPVFDVMTDTGARYDPVTDSWATTSTGANVPAARTFHTAVWTGAEMIVWGGSPLTNTGGRYDPLTDTWTPTSTGQHVPLSTYFHSAVWTGAKMLVWGGWSLESSLGLYCVEGAP